MPTLDFKGKRHIYAHHLTVPYRPLVPEPEKSVGDCPDDDNLIIHGDNLHALKALLPRYAGRVKCIYIDPPYNTGNEGWSYNDNANGPILNQWLEQEAAIDEEDQERHDKWLCMMWPRLHLLKELLSEDGVIFVSIDDNEQHHLRMLMNEIFGEQNFVANFVWQSKDTPGNNSSGIADTHSYVLAYRKSNSFAPNLLERSEDQLANYSNPDDDPRGRWLGAPLTRSEHRDRDVYEIENGAGRMVMPPAGSSWRRPREMMERLQADDRIWWGVTGDADFPMEKKFLSEAKPGVVNQTWWPYRFAGSTRNAGAELKRVFGGEKVFDTPKPTALLHRILALSTSVDSIVLDSFAGSGTTAHAVLALNKQDGGSRRFILVECEEYADSITAERVRRVIAGVPDTKDVDLREGLDSTFTYCTLGDPVTASGMLNGDTLPPFAELAAWLMHTATGQSVGPTELRPLDEHGLIYSDSGRNYYLRYQPDLEWLRSNEAVLTEGRAEDIAEICRQEQKQAVVFAAGKYIELDDLSELGIMFGGLPFEIRRSEQV